MSTMVLGPTVDVDAPLPLAAPYGLLAVAQTLPPQADEHYLNGVVVEPYPDGPPLLWAECRDGSIGDVKADGPEGMLLPTFSPFTVYLPVTCRTWDARPDDRFRERAVRAFEAKEGWGVERQFAADPLGLDSPALADGDVDRVNGNTAVSPTEALALLEAGIQAGIQQQGVIEVSPSLATYWASQSLLVKDGLILRTWLGTPVAVGGGFAGIKPVGGTTPAGTREWAFASGRVAIRRTEPVIYGTEGETVIRSINEKTIRVERHYVLVWDKALQLAVYVDRSL